MRFIADRFVVLHDRRVVDLATGRQVTLLVGNAGGESEQARWAIRCDALQNLHHHLIAPLVDYGVLGESQRFEAWECGASWSGSSAEREHVLTIAVRFLHACGRTASGGSSDAVRSSSSRQTGSAVYLPDDEAGYSSEGLTVEPGDISLDACGLATIERGIGAALVEMFHVTGESRPQVVAVFGPPGAGKTRVARDIARSARLHGLIPVSTRLAPTLELPENRSLCLVSDAPDATPWPTLVGASIRWPRPHVMVVTALEEVRGVHSVRLTRIQPAALVQAVRPRMLPAKLQMRIHGAATRAQGLPGRFVQLLWPALHVSFRQTAHVKRHRSRVAEQPATYGVDHESRLWSSSGELASLRDRMATALQWVDAGRHAPGVRLLRRTIGALARRDDWLHARDGAFALATSLVRRGNPREAQGALDEVRRYSSLSGDGAQNASYLIDVATLHAVAWTDLAKLDQAETSIGGALAAARAAGDAARVASTSYGLARCLFWRGQYGDAKLALMSLDPARCAPGLALANVRLGARLSVGSGDLAGAMAAAAEGMERARHISDARAQREGLSAACCAAAFVHLAIGDLSAVTRDVAAALAHARAARDPLRAVRARLILAEADRRLGRRRAATSVIGRLLKLQARLPPLLLARCRLVHDVLVSEAPPSEILARHIAATGLGALELCLPRERPPHAGEDALDPLAREVIAILHVCQTADEETRVLSALCERIRRHLHAAGVAFVTTGGSAPACLASAGARMSFGVAVRAATAGFALAPHHQEAPHHRETCVEAAAPVQYGGSIIAALAARWTIGSPHDLSQALAVLAMASAASAPVVSGALARQAAVAVPALGALLGVTPAMVDLRRSVERAAVAPFPVLIEGESGCGKELVARAVHRCGPRRTRPFCTLNCAALPEDLVEAELFGHARGAFTGAHADRAGVFEEADSGTLLLDEIGELSSRAQAKVLRVIQEGELRRVGENVSRRIDVRIVAATNRDLTAEVSAGRFRLDLLYRLDVIRIAVPPLRERPEDVPVLVDHFWREATTRMGSRATLAPATVAALARHGWPGNVRELQNVLASLAVRCPKRGIVPPAALPPQLAVNHGADCVRLDQARRIFEDRFVRAALVRTGGHRARAAGELGVSRQGLTKLMTRLGIEYE